MNVVVDVVDIEHGDLEAALLVERRERLDRVDQLRMRDDEVIVAVRRMLPVVRDDRSERIGLGERAVERGEKLDARGRCGERVAAAAERASGAARAVAAVKHRRALAAIAQLDRAIGGRLERQHARVEIARERIARLEPVEHDDVDGIAALASHGSLRFGTRSRQRVAARFQRRGRELDLAAHFIAAVPARASRPFCR